MWKRLIAISTGAELAVEDLRRRREAEPELARKEAALRDARENLARSEAANRELEAELDAHLPQGGRYRRRLTGRLRPSAIGRRGADVRRPPSKVALLERCEGPILPSSVGAQPWRESKAQEPSCLARDGSDEAASFKSHRRQGGSTTFPALRCGLP